MRGDISTIKAVAFDIDGTLYPNYRMYLASLPVVLTHLALFSAFGRARKQVRRERPGSFLHARTVDIVSHIMNEERSIVAREINETIYGEWEERLARVPLYREVEGTLRWLRDKNIRTAALSDFPVERKLAMLGVTDLFDVAFSSEETGHLKPNPEPFRRLSHELETPPDRILYVGNSYRYDILGARACGFQTAHLVGRRRRRSLADLSFSRFRDLRRWLEVRIDPAV